MLKRLTAARLAVIAATLLSACGESRSVLVAPVPGDAGALPLGVVTGPDGAGVHPLRREISLANEITWSFDAGPEGTVVRQSTTGLTISIPKGALSAPTRITVSALKGGHLAYRFAPHGLQFAAPVTLTQTLGGLKIRRDAFGFPHLVGGYFVEDALAVDATTGVARVNELLPVWIDGKGKSLSLEIRHFSGYTVASALVDPEDEHP